ncbi:MAG TPA: TIGR03943 family protein [Actinomycetota bacterium]|nr:TIGR03943 family protein [Actinomycetota bacterium]
MSIAARPTEIAAPTKRWSPRRVAGAGVLGCWAAMFWFLLIAGRSNLYLSTRTDWVIPVGAVILSAAFIGRVLSARTVVPESLDRRESLILAAMVVPVLVVMVLPPTALNSFAASRRSAIGGAGFVSSTGDISHGDLSLVDLAGSTRTVEGRRALAARAGDTVSFTGFVTRDPGTPADEFTLTRFVVSCCIADALSVEVHIVGAPPGAFKNDDWVTATGKVYPLAQETILDASQIDKVERPKHPYITP